MGTPEAAGRGWSAADRETIDAGAGHQPATDRAATIEQLRAELEAVTVGRPPARAFGPAGSDLPGTAGSSRGTASTAGAGAAPATIGRTRGRAAAIGSSGTTDRRRVPPPDDGDGDEPGDPVAVAKAICLRMLTGAARTRADLLAALRKRGIDQEVAAGVLDRLTEVGLVDDAAYAQAFVAAKHRDRGLGRAALRTELRRKGVDPAVAAAAADGIDDHAERRRATDLVAKRLDAAMFAGPDTARRRLLGLLARRGYPPGLAIAVVDEALRGFVPAQPPGSDGMDDGGDPTWSGAAWGIVEPE